MDTAQSPFSTMPSFANLPTEIESKILGYLTDDKRALYSTIRVSQAWHEHTNDFLWQHFSARDLAMIEGLPQRQHYADKVVKLDVSSLTCYRRFEYLSFPSLTEVVLGADTQRDYRPKVGSVWISSYLQPTLRKLHLTQLFVMTIDAMDLMCLSCPLLEELSLGCQLAFDGPEMYLLRSPFNFPKLRRLEYHWDIIFLPSTMERLSDQLPSLEYLDIAHLDLDMWGGDSGPVFPKLRTLLLQLYPGQFISDLEQNFKQVIATNHLSTLLRLAPQLETFRLAWSSPVTHQPFQEVMDVNELRSLR